MLAQGPSLTQEPISQPMPQATPWMCDESLRAWAPGSRGQRSTLGSSSSLASLGQKKTCSHCGRQSEKRCKKMSTLILRESTDFPSRALSEQRHTFSWPLPQPLCQVCQTSPRTKGWVPESQLLSQVSAAPGIYGFGTIGSV